MSSKRKNQPKSPGRNEAAKKSKGEDEDPKTPPRGRSQADQDSVGVPETPPRQVHMCDSCEEVVVSRLHLKAHKKRFPGGSCIDKVVYAPKPRYVHTVDTLSAGVAQLEDGMFKSNEVVRVMHPICIRGLNGQTTKSLVVDSASNGSMFKGSFLVTEKRVVDAGDEVQGPSSSATGSAPIADEEGDDEAHFYDSDVSHVVTAYEALKSVLRDPLPPHGPVVHSTRLLERDGLDLYSQIDGLLFKVYVTFSKWTSQTAYPT